MDKYTNAVYGSAWLTAFFASLTLYEWGFIIGMAFSMALGIVTYRMNRREQKKRTELLQHLVDHAKTSGASSSAAAVASVMSNAPRDI